MTWFFLKDVLCVSALPDSCLPQTPLFPLSGVLSAACRAVGCPQGAGGEAVQVEALFSPTLRTCERLGFVCTSLSWPVTAQNSSDSSVLRHTGIKRETRRDLSTLSLAHEGELPQDAQCQGQKAHGELGGLVYSQLCSFSGPATLAKGLNFLIPLVPPCSNRGITTGSVCLQDEMRQSP